ncbi:MAG: hypothetical protein K9N51_05105 [Candidatus Pacebacteria bacterium]|nr:hypothetical protein [Candidatus Paceibacterota bacterium]
MEITTLIGTLVALAALAVVITAYVWSVRIIHMIDCRNLTSLREIKKALRDGGKDS